MDYEEIETQKTFISYKCNKCGNTYAFKDQMEKHMVTDHVIPQRELNAGCSTLVFLKNQQEINAVDLFSGQPGWWIIQHDLLENMPYEEWKVNQLSLIQQIQTDLRTAEEFIAQHPECKL